MMDGRRYTRDDSKRGKYRMGFAYSAVVGYEGGSPCGCLSLLFCCLAFCEQPGDKPSPSTGWQQLDLAKTDVTGATVYYEKCLDPNQPPPKQ